MKNMYHRPRVIPVLSIDNGDLVKTVKYSNPRYLGDPLNAVKIFNGKYVDELCILDIRASKDNEPIDFNLLTNIATQAFMPLSYGGGIKTLDDMKKLFRIGYEKVVINTSFFLNPEIVKIGSNYAGSQSIVVAIDVKQEKSGKKNIYIKSGTEKINMSPLEGALLAEKMGAGEIIINSINQEGMMSGYDLELINEISNSVSIPVIANCGASNILDLKKALDSGAHAVAASSIFVYYGTKKAVLITFPNEKELVNMEIYKNL